MESPRASRSALSRWIPSGRCRSLSFPLSLLRYPAPTFHFALRPPLSLGHEAGEDEARRYLLSFPRPQRNDRARLRRRATTSWWGAVPRVYPRGHLLHNDRNERVRASESKIDEDGVLLLLPRRARARSRTSSRGLTETTRPICTHTYVATCVRASVWVAM